MTITELLEVLPQPLHPVEIVDMQQWSLFELSTGIDLPADYKDYLHIFGTGVIGGIISPYNPFCQRALKVRYTCRDWMRELYAIQALKQKFGNDVFPYSVYPEEGGLLPWGSTDNGDRFYWHTDGPPHAWTVVLQEVRSSHFTTFAYSMTGFLRAWIIGTIQDDLIPFDAIDHDLLFETW